MSGLNPTGVVAFVLLDIAIILVAARLCGAAAKKMGQPSVVGEIIAGVLLGPSLLGATIFLWSTPPDWLNCQTALGFNLAPGTTAPDPSITGCLFPPQARSVLNVIGQVALLFFMFLVGLELDYDKLKGHGRSIMLVTIGVVAVPVLVGFALQPVLFQDVFKGPMGDNALAFDLFIGATLSVTALPVMARILQEKGLAASQMGAIGVAAAAGVTVLMFALVAVAGTVASSAAAGTSALPKILRQVGLTIVYIAAMFLIVRPALARLLEPRYQARVTARGGPEDAKAWSEVDEFDPAGIGWALTHSMFAWVVVLVFASGLVAHLLGINVIVGGFLAGAVLPARAGLTRDMTAELFDVTVIVLLPVFLAFSGLNTDFNQLWSSFGDAVLGLLVFLAAAIVAKVASGAVFGRLGGLSWQEGMALGSLMNCRGLLPLVVALIGLQTQVISPVLQVTIVVMALVTTIMTGPMFDAFNPAKREQAASREAAPA